MRKAFRHYFRPTAGELSGLWEKGLFSFDASVLLNVYGYSNETRTDLVGLIEKNKERICLPHQFGLEYARNRCSVIVKQVNNYLKVEKELEQIKTSSIAPKREHPFLSPRGLEAFVSIQKELKESRKLLEKMLGNDPYSEELVELFEDKVGEAPAAEDLVELHKKADTRYKSQIPPGYSDRGKGVPEAYGDYIGWHQLMKIAKTAQRGVIFVIDDFKEDWWQMERERTVGPRPELLEEFHREADQDFYMYTSENFLRAAKRFLSLEIRDDLIEEVSQRLESQRESQRSREVKAEKGQLKSPEKVNNPLKPIEAIKEAGDLPKGESGEE